MSNLDGDVSDASLDRDFLSYLSLAEKCVRNKDLRKCQKWFEKLCSKIYTDRDAKKRRNAYLKRLLIAINKNQQVPSFEQEPPLRTPSPSNKAFNTKIGGEFSNPKQVKKSMHSTRNFDRTTFDRKTYTVKKPLYTKDGICGRLSVTIGGKRTKNCDTGGSLSPQRSPKRCHSSIEGFGASLKEKNFLEESSDHTKSKKGLINKTSTNPSETSLRNKFTQRQRSRSASSGSVMSAKHSKPQVIFTDLTHLNVDPCTNEIGNQFQDEVINLFEDSSTTTRNELKPDELYHIPIIHFQCETWNACNDINDPLQNNKKATNLFSESTESSDKGSGKSARETRCQEKKASFKENSEPIYGNWNFKLNDDCAKPTQFQYTTEKNTSDNGTGLREKKLPSVFEDTPKSTGDNIKPVVKLDRSTYVRYTTEKAGGESLRDTLQQNILVEKPPEPTRKLAGGFDQPEPLKSDKGARGAESGSKFQSQQDRPGQNKGSIMKQSERKTRYTTYKSTTGENEKTSILAETIESEPSTRKTIKSKSLKSRIKDSLTPNRGVDKPVDVEKISLTTAYDEFCSKQPTEERNMVCDLYRAYPEAIVNKLLELWKAEGQAVIEDYKQMHKQKLETMKNQFREDVDDKARNFQGEKEDLKKWRDCKVQLDRMMNDLTYLHGGETEWKQLMEALRMEISEENTKLDEENELNSKFKAAILKLSTEKDGLCAEARTHGHELKTISEKLHVELAETFKEYEEQQALLAKIV